MKRFIAVACAASVFLSGCAQKAENIQSAYVSPTLYQGMSCKQIQAEAQRISARTAEAIGIQDKNAQNDAIATGVAVVLFFPAAFFIKGNRENASQVARLKGELEALEQASIAGNCGITFQKASAPA